MNQTANDQRTSIRNYLTAERITLLLAAVSTLIYFVICYNSRYFAYGSNKLARPIPMVLGCFAFAFVLYLLAVQFAIRIQSGWKLLALIFLPALLFRGIMLWSHPIQEIDIYRYLWDGAVYANGVSPFKYPPAQVRKQLRDRQPESPEDLKQLAMMAESRPGLKDALERIHYGQVPTVYPPTSQMGFALVDRLTPGNADLRTRLNNMRAFLILCEMLSIGIVVLLLHELGRPIGLAILVAWCPLLVKETANSGHLDSMAVLLTTLAVYFGIRMLRPGPSRPLGWSVAAAATLALAIGAKLYPVAFGLWFLAISLKSLGWKKTLAPGVVLIAMTWLVMLPVVPPEYLGNKQPAVVNPDEGFKTFLSRWEMNDFLFLIAIENVRIRDDIHEDYRAWFSIVPDAWQRGLNEWVVERFEVEPKRVAFVVSRFLTAIAFCGLASWFAWRTWQVDVESTDGRERALEMAFLTVAWFWLLCPTLNPWYWSWALPLLPFARSRVWWLMSGVLFAYYLRFWFTYQFEDIPVAGTTYRGSTYFDLVVTWYEFAPWFGLLMLDGATGIISRLFNRHTAKDV
ncbi:MAG: hypothetical protein AAF497_05135 [Planctomycetota bacterium]